jgi:hypothetical protein
MNHLEGRKEGIVYGIVLVPGSGTSLVVGLVAAVLGEERGEALIGVVPNTLCFLIGWTTWHT